MKVAKLNIDGYIGQADILSMFSGDSSFSLKDLKTFLDSLPSDVTDLSIYINSGGGSVTEGWAIYDKLKASGLNITTIGEGIVGSIATIIFMSGKERMLHNNTSFFIHNPYWQPDSPTPMEAGDLSRLSDELKLEEEKILNFYATQTGSNIEEIRTLMNNATSLNSQTAIELGFATSVIGDQIAAKNYKIAACVNYKIKNKMEKNILDAINEGFKNLQSLFKKKEFKNLDVMATDSNGNQVTLMVDTQTGDLQNAPAFVVDANGNQTPAPDGNYVDDQGRTIVVLGGIVTEVIDVSGAADAVTVENLKKQLADLKSENDALQVKLNAEANKNKIANDKMIELNTQFESFKGTLIKAGMQFDEGTQTFKSKDEVKETGFGADAKTRFRN